MLRDFFEQQAIVKQMLNYQPTVLKIVFCVCSLKIAKTEQEYVSKFKTPKLPTDSAKNCVLRVWFKDSKNRAGICE